MQEKNVGAGFRHDINGLRAWAVSAVILYHFDLPGASGGFIGVDIFFVISGFLMTGLIVEKLEAGSFSSLDFYLARGKRIMPALAVLCASLLGAGYALLQAPDYKALATQATYSLAFLSNIEFWQQAGYFDSASHEKWLLHTWSLSVEWQFYMVLPLVLAAIWKCAPGRRVLLVALAAATALSFGFCVATTATAPSAAFYLLPYRAWEMLAGALVFLLSAPGRLSGAARGVLHYLGLFLILAANLAFDHHSPWPGSMAALPVLATVFVILSARTSVWLVNPVTRWLGDRSYSLYLWHWPVYVGLVFSELRSHPLALAAGLVLTLVLGHLSYVLVEQRAKAWLGARRPQLAAVAMCASLFIIMAPAVWIWRVHGLPGRFPAAVERIAQEANNVNPRRRECHTNSGREPSRCQYGSGNGKVIVLGDSHADALVTGVSSALNSLQLQVVQMSYSACPYVEGMRVSYPSQSRKNREYDCVGFVRQLARELATSRSSEPVIVINRYGSAAFGWNENPALGPGPQVLFAKDHVRPDQAYLDEFAQAIVTTACNLAKKREVYLVRPIPEIGTDVPKTLARRVSFGLDADMSIARADYEQRNAWVWKAQDRAREECGVKILDPLPYLCSGDRCYGSKDGRPIYSDDDHLSEHGNKLLVPMYLEAFKTSQP